MIVRRPTIAVIGDAGIDPKSQNYILAEKLGKSLVDNGYRIVNGGMTGIMEACCKGALQSEEYSEGRVVCILPGFNPNYSNHFAEIVIPTGLDIYRNAIVANSDAVIAIGGRAGTLSEMAFSWTLKRMLIAYDVAGWSGQLAGTKIDDRRRIEWDGDKVFKVKNEIEVISLLKNYLHHYSERHETLIQKMKDEKLI